MKIAIRADASVRIGTGHVMRCLSLADLLRERGAQVSFISRKLNGNLAQLIEMQGFTAELLEVDADCSSDDDSFLSEKDALKTKAVIKRLGGCDWLIVDNYLIDMTWEIVLRNVAKRIFVIDDLANRRHNCNGLLDQNLHKDIEARYTGLVPSGCRMFLGPEYALLRKEFLEEKRLLMPKTGQIKHILVNFGGSDAHDMASVAIDACREVFSSIDIQVTVIAGASNPNKAKLQRLCADSSLPVFVYYEQVSNMARLMANSDLAIGAGGSSHWERCFLGLPALVITTADNQVEITKAVAEKGACIYVADVEKEDRNTIRQKLACALADLIQQPDKLMVLSKEAALLMPNRDGFDVMLDWLWHCEGTKNNVQID